MNLYTAAPGSESEYSYSYEYADGYLTKAVFNGTGDKKIEYLYSYEDGKLTTITDAEGNKYGIIYDGQAISKFVYPNQGIGFAQLNQSKVTLIANHINSVARASLNGCTPFKLAQLLIDRKLLELCDLKDIPADQVILKPTLLKH